MGEAAERLAGRLDPLADEIQKNLPKAEQIATGSKRFVDLLEERISPEQKEDLKRTGYSFFDEEQLGTLKGEKVCNSRRFHFSEDIFVRENGIFPIQIKQLSKTLLPLFCVRICPHNEEMLARVSGSEMFQTLNPTRKKF